VPEQAERDQAGPVIAHRWLETCEKNRRHKNRRGNNQTQGIETERRNFLDRYLNQ